MEKELVDKYLWRLARATLIELQKSHSCVLCGSKAALIFFPDEGRYFCSPCLWKCRETDARKISIWLQGHFNWGETVGQRNKGKAQAGIS